MRIVIDILHPAHVHVFRNFIFAMQKRGHQIFVTAREKDVTLRLLSLYNIPFVQISTQRHGSLALFFELLIRNFRFWRFCSQVHPDLLMGIMGPTISLVGYLQGIPAYTFYDTETAKLTNWFAFPLSTAVVTPHCFPGSVGRRHIAYRGYHELAYLHPSRFIPDKKVLSSLGISPQEQYFVVRIVSWRASHDLGMTGCIDPTVLISELQKFGRVLISSEGVLPSELEPYRLCASPEQIHHVMAFATLFTGESVTMASEAAMLGVPAVLIFPYSLSYIADLERKYGLVFRFADQQAALVKIKELLETPSLHRIWAKKRQRLLIDCVDVTQWMIDFIEHEYRALKR